MGKNQQRANAVSCGSLRKVQIFVGEGLKITHMISQKFQLLGVGKVLTTFALVPFSFFPTTHLM